MKNTYSGQYFAVPRLQKSENDLKNTQTIITDVKFDEELKSEIRIRL